MPINFVNPGDSNMADEAKPAASAETKKSDAPKKVTPTPTQDELNQIAEGKHPELANDGSGPDPTEKLNTVRHIGAKDKPGGDYSTRSMKS